MPEIVLPPGTGQVEFRIMLPEGYKLNSEAQSTLQIGDGPAQQVVAEKPVLFAVNLSRAATIDLDLTAYYCQEEAAQLCLIHMARLKLPVKIDDHAPEQARVIYSF